jgi:hypothetical protein
MRPMQILLVAGVAVSTLACDKIPFLGGGEDPAAVARDYWAAVAQNDQDASAEFAVVLDQENTVSMTNDSETALTNMVVAAAVVDGEIATSRTTMHAANPQMQADLDFITTLRKIDSEWKVDQNATLEAMMNNAMEQVLGVSGTEVMDDMANVMGDAVEEMAEGLVQTMQGAAESLAEGMGEASSTVSRPSVGERPWNPEMIGTIDPGMTREQVIAVWGEPVTERFTDRNGYMFYRNGCEIACGMYDTVLLEGNQVIDAVIRGAGHVYSGISSSPPGRMPEETLPETVG